MIRSREEYPFLNWVGGKNRLIVHLLPFVPSEFIRYWEPFLGAGALYFALAPTSAVLSDLNQDLINCYIKVRDHPEQIYDRLNQHQINHSKSHYYSVRSIFNTSHSSVSQAARFIYLNKACFNGIYRVNKKGKFNVPYGKNPNPSLPSAQHLRNVSRILAGAEIHHSPFQLLLENYSPSSGDFVYLDPPYPPLNGTAYFRHYTSDRFSLEDHARVAEFATTLRDLGCKVMISNADTKRIRTLYSNWNVNVLPVTRWVAANGSRQRINELVITNYNLK